MTVYKMIQVVGTSKKNFADAARAAVERATETLHDVRWFEVKEMRGRVDAGKIAEFQVKVDIAFHLDGGSGASTALAPAGKPRSARGARRGRGT